MYQWGNRSLELKTHLHPDGNVVVDDALFKYSTVDVGITSTIRTYEEQLDNIASGVSQTPNTRHRLARPTDAAQMLFGQDFDDKQRSWAHAFDVVAYLSGKATYDEEPYFAFAEAMRISAVKNGVPFVWGGCWCDVTKYPSIYHAMKYYLDKCARNKRKPFLDLGHWELARSAYPALYTDM